MSGACSDDERIANLADLRRGVRGDLRAFGRGQLGAGDLPPATRRMGMAGQAGQIGTADALVRLARDLVPGRIRHQPAGAAVDAPLVAAALARLGGAARRHGPVRVSYAQLLPALIA